MAANEPDSLSTLFRSIEDARDSGRRDGVEACLRFLRQDTEDAPESEVGVAIDSLDQEMVRRLWIPPPDQR